MFYVGELLRRLFGGVPALSPPKSRIHMKRPFVILSIVFLMDSCKENPVSSPVSEETDMQEVVFRHQFASNGSGFADTTAKFFFLAIVVVDSNHHVKSSADPSDEFMTRFSSNKPPVKKYTQATIQPSGGVYDKDSGLRGLLFRVGQIRKTSETEAEVEGGYYAGGLNAEGDVFYLRRSNGRWWVYRVQYFWVS